MTDYIRITPEGHIRVTDAAPFNYIVSYTALPDINKMVGDPIALPNTVVATRKSGAVETLIVKWEPASTEVAGTFYISGSIGNGAGVVTQKVIVSQLSDIDILRQIRDANPTSQLPTLWLDSEDPYTQWEGVSWEDSRVTELGMRFLDNKGITSMPSVNKLAKLQVLRIPGNNISSIDLSGLVLLRLVSMEGNKLVHLDLTGTINIVELYVNLNRLPSIASLTSKGAVIAANFTRNLMPPTETNRLLAMGFTSVQVLPQDI